MACLEDFQGVSKIESPSLDPWVDAPLVHATFSASEFITKGESKVKIVEQGGVLTLMYDDSISSPSMAEYFAVPDQKSPEIAIPASELTFLSSESDTVTRDFTFQFASSHAAGLDSIWMNTGEIVIQTNSTFDMGVHLSFSTRTIQLNGVPLSQEFDFNTPGEQTTTMSLDNHTFDFTLDGASRNTVSCTITAIFINKGKAINPDDKVKVRLALNNVRFRAFFGQFGTHTVHIPTDSIGFDVFEGLKAKNFILQSPLVDIQIRNSFGIPVGLDIVSFTAFNDEGSALPLTGAVVSSPANPYLIAAPDYSQLGQSVSSTITISGYNSNLGALIGLLPNRISFAFGATLNPGISQPQNFILDTSRVRVALHAELPFYGQAQEISYSKRFPLSGLSGIDSVLNVPDVGIKMRTSNEFPFEASIQAYFLSETGRVIDSLFTDPTILKAAPVNDQGLTQSASEFVTIVPLSQERIDGLKEATEIEIAVAISTTNNGTVPVKFTTSDRLRVVIGLHTRMQYDVD
jgi:hypothetical protein